MTAQFCVFSSSRLSTISILYFFEKKDCNIMKFYSGATFLRDFLSDFVYNTYLQNAKYCEKRS